MRIRLLVLSLLVTACAGTTTQTHWKVKDSKQVVVKRAGNVVLDASVPTATDGPVQLERGGDGSLALRCATCRLLAFTSLIAADGNGFAGYASDAFANGLRSKPSFEYPIQLVADSSFQAGPTITTSSRTTYDIVLSTPWQNVEHLRAERTVNRWSTVSQIAIGVALAAFGAYLISDETLTNVLIAYPALGAGAALTLHGAWVAITGTKSWTVYP